VRWREWGEERNAIASSRDEMKFECGCRSVKLSMERRAADSGSGTDVEMDFTFLNGERDGPYIDDSA